MRTNGIKKLFILIATSVSIVGVSLKPAAAQSAAGQVAIQAANDAMNTVLTDVAEEGTDAAGIFTGLPVHDAGTGQEIVEMNTSVNEETMAAADGIIKSIYNQMGYPAIAPTALNAELDTIVSTAPTVAQVMTQLPGAAIDSSTGTELSNVEDAATLKDEGDLAVGFAPALNARMTTEREGIEGNALQDLTEAEAADKVLSGAKTTANEEKDLASGIQMSVQTTLLVAKELNDERKQLANIAFDIALPAQREDESLKEEAADEKATLAMLD